MFIINNTKFQKIIALPTEATPKTLSVTLGQKTNTIGVLHKSDGTVVVSITTTSKSEPTSRHSFSIPLNLQNQSAVQEILRDTLRLIDQDRSDSNIQKLRLIQNISNIRSAFTQMFMDPKQIADKVPITLDGLFPELQFLVKNKVDEQGPTIYTCGRPTEVHFSAMDKEIINGIANSLLSFLHATTTQVTDQAAQPRPNYPNQGSICNPKVDVPAPFERWLTHIEPVLEAEGLTDTYSIFQSIRFLMAKNRIDSGDNNSSSYCLNERYQTQNISTEAWTHSLAQAMYLVEKSYVEIFQKTEQSGWEASIETFLKEQLGFQQDSFKNFFNDNNLLETGSRAKLPSLNDDPTQFLQTFLEDCKRYSDMTEDQKILVKGLVYCYKTKLKEFVLAFTAGAKGRERNNNGYNGQCGAEYAKRAQSAITAFSQKSTEPITFTEFILQSIRHIRIEVLRGIFVGNSIGENTTFENHLRTIETMPNPNSNNEGTIFLERMTLEHCVSELHKIFANATVEQRLSWQKLLENEGNLTISIESWGKSRMPIYRYLKELGLCQKQENWLPQDIQQQETIIKKLVLTILLLHPDHYQPGHNVLDVSLPNHVEAFNVVKQRLLNLCTTLSGLTDDHKAFIQQGCDAEELTLSNDDIRSMYPNYHDLVDLLRFSSKLTCCLVSYCRNEITKADLDPLNKLAEFYTLIKDGFTPGLIRSERSFILDSNLDVSKKSELVKTLYSLKPDLMTTDLLQAERCAILDSNLYDSKKFELVKTLYSLKSDLITPNLLQEERSAILDSNLDVFNKLYLINTLYLLNPNLMTLDQIQALRSEVLGANFLGASKVNLIKKLYSVNPELITPDLLQAERCAILGSNLHDSNKSELVKTLYSQNPDLMITNLFQSELSAILDSNLDVFHKFNLINTLYSLKPDLMTTDLLQEERSAILSSKLKDSEKSELVKTLYSLNPELITPNLLQAERCAILDSNLHHSNKSELVKTLYSQNPDLMTTHLFQSEQSAILASNLGVFNKFNLINTLFSLYPNLMTLDQLQAVRSAVLGTNLPGDFKTHLIQKLYSVNPDLMTMELLLSERSIILNSTLGFSSQVDLVKELYQLNPHLESMTPILDFNLNDLIKVNLVRELDQLNPRRDQLTPLEVQAREILASNLTHSIKLDLVKDLFLLDPSSLRENVIKNVYIDLVRSREQQFINPDTFIDLTRQLLILNPSLFSPAQIYNDFHNPETGWKWDLLNTQWRNVEKTPLTMRLRDYYRTQFSPSVDMVRILIETEQIRNQNTQLNMMIYIGHLKMMDPNSRKAQIILEALQVNR